eukprot:5934311-Prymnesium_polylepis.2
MPARCVSVSSWVSASRVSIFKLVHRSVACCAEKPMKLTKPTSEIAANLPAHSAAIAGLSCGSCGSPCGCVVSGRARLCGSWKWWARKEE